MALVFDEQLATGWAKIELHGNFELAALHVRNGRTVLGQVRTQYGVNSRIAEDEAGGFYSLTKTMPDGTVITATTNNGFDTIRIDAPGGARQPKIEPKTKSNGPFIWIGARIVSGAADVIGNRRPPDDTFDIGDYVKLHLCLWEENSAISDRYEILSNRHHLWADAGFPTGVDSLFMNANAYPLQSNKTLPEGDNKGIGYTASGMIQLSKRYRDYVASQLNIDLTDALIAPDDDGSHTEYDEVIICDPSDSYGLGKVGNAIGNYVVKVMAQADDCTDFTPAKIELKIIIEEQERVSYVHEFTISEFTKYWRGVLPKGYWRSNYTPGLCEAVPDYGNNPMGGHWWPGAANIMVAPRQTDFPEESITPSVVAFGDDRDVPPTGFVDEGWPGRDDRCVLCTTVFTAYNMMDDIGEPVYSGAGGSYLYARFNWSGSRISSYSPVTGKFYEKIFFDFFGLPTSCPFNGVVVSASVSMSLNDLINGVSVTSSAFGEHDDMSVQCAWKTMYWRDDNGGLHGTAQFISNAEYAAAGGTAHHNVGVNSRVAYPYGQVDGEGNSTVPYFVDYSGFWSTSGSYASSPWGAPY